LIALKRATVGEEGGKKKRVRENGNLLALQQINGGHGSASFPI